MDSRLILFFGSSPPISFPNRENMTIVRRIHWVVGCGLLMAGCQPPPSANKAAATPPAKVATIAQEDKLNTTVLTPEAEKRLDIQLASVVSKPVVRSRTFGGEVTLPADAALVVSAPVVGTLQAASKTGVPKAGSTIGKKQPVFLLLPLLSPERNVLTPAERVRFAEAKMTLSASQIDAEGQVQRAQVQLDAAKIALDRAERLLREQAGTIRAVDEAKANVELAEKTLGAAASRKTLLDQIKLDEEAGTLEPLVIESPQEGTLRATHAAPGEVVPAGAPLFEVVDYRTMWVKVSVYVGELSEIVADQPARVSNLAESRGENATAAKPIVAPPTATPLASSADLYYELDNPNGKFRPGQRVSATLTLQGQAENRVIPWSAVVQDINGGTWVYEQTAPYTFVRRRVQVRFVSGPDAILSEGPAAGAQIVISGVAELFGTEFGFAK